MDRLSAANGGAECWATQSRGCLREERKAPVVAAGRPEPLVLRNASARKPAARQRGQQAAESHAEPAQHACWSRPIQPSCFEFSKARHLTRYADTNPKLCQIWNRHLWSLTIGRTLGQNATFQKRHHDDAAALLGGVPTDCESYEASKLGCDAWLFGVGFGRLGGLAFGRWLMLKPHPSSIPSRFASRFGAGRDAFHRTRISLNCWYASRKPSRSRK